MPIPLSPDTSQPQMFTAIPGARVIVAYQPKYVEVQRTETVQQPVRVPRGAEYTADVTRQYGVMSWEKELPSIIHVQPKQVGFFESIWQTWFEPIPKGNIEKAKQIYEQRTQQAEVAASVIIIGYTAVSLAHSAYTVAKGYWPQSREEKIVERALTVTEPEVLKPMTVTRISGPEGARIPQSVEVTPQEKALAKDFNITWTKGTPTTPMRTTLDKLLQNTKGSMFVPELILAKPLPQTVHIPFVVNPWQITQFTLAGMSLGRLFASREAAGIPSLIPAPISIQVPRARSVERLNLGLVNVHTPRIDLIEDLQQAQEQAQTPQQAQIQEQKQALQQRSLMEVPNQLRPYDPFDLTRRRRGKKQQRIGDFYGRYHLKRPIAEAEQFKKVMFGV